MEQRSPELALSTPFFAGAKNVSAGKMKRGLSRDRYGLEEHRYTNICERT